MKNYKTTREAAEQMNISLNEARGLCRLGVLSGAFKDENGEWQIPVESINHWIANQKKSDPMKNQKGNRLSTIKKWSKRRIAFVATVVVSLIAILAGLTAIASDFEAAKKQLQDWHILNQVKPAKKDELLVIVTEFKGTGDYDPTTRIYNSLFNAIEEIKGVRVERITDSPQNSREAISIGERYKAILVIWGSFDDAAVEPRLEVLRPHKVDYVPSELEQTINANSPSYNFYMAKELPTLYEYFTFVALGQIYSAKKDFDSGISMFNKALDLSVPTQSTMGVDGVFRLRGMAYLSMSNMDKAREDFEESIKVNPDQLDAYTTLATIQLLSLDYQAALDTVNMVIALHPEFWFAHETRGLIYYYQENYYSALIEFDLSFQLVVENSESMSLDIDLMQSVTYGHRGLVYHAMGEIERARSDYQQAIALNPSDGVTYHNIGHLELESGNPSIALSYFEKALRLGYADPKTYQGRGVAFRQLGKHESAMDDFELVIEMAPEYGGGYYERGVLYIVIEDFEKALADFNRTIEIWPDNVQAYHSRIAVLIELNRYDEAEKDLSTLINLEPSNIENYIQRGWINLDNNHLELALHDFEIAVSINPDDPRGYVGHGITTYSLGNTEEALADFGKAIDLDARNFASFYGRGMIYLDLDNYNSAIQDFTNALLINPNDAATYYLRFQAFTAINNYEAALSDCQNYLNLSQEHEVTNEINTCILKVNEGYIIPTKIWPYITMIPHTNEP